MSSCRSATDENTYGFKTFGNLDNTEVLHVGRDAMPYRRALLHQAAVAVKLQRNRGQLRNDIQFQLDDVDVVSDFEKKPDIERWLSRLVGEAQAHPS